MINLNKIVGENLSSLRKETNSFIKSITYFLDITSEEYWEYEDGKKEMSYQLIERISDYYCLPSFLLFEGTFDLMNEYLDKCKNVLIELNEILEKENSDWVQIHNDREVICKFFKIVDNYNLMSNKLEEEI